MVERSRALAEPVGEAAERVAADAAILLIEALWQGEGLGILLWAFSLTELPPYDRPFDHLALVGVEIRSDARLRPATDVAGARETARLWLWRARTVEVQGEVELPAPWESFDQLVAATAMRGHERGLLPRPLRGDFPAFGTVYRALDDDQFSEAFSIAWERGRALDLARRTRQSWDDICVQS